MRIKSENEILDEGVRKKIIEEICGSENQERKAEHYRRHKCFKDKTRYFTIEQLQKQFDYATVVEMTYAIPNISIVKKVINKLATVYNNGVQRMAVNEAGENIEEITDVIQDIEKELQVNQKQKQVNKYLKLHKNALQYVKPCPNPDGTYGVVLQPLAPHLYDVIEDYYDRTKPLVYILSYYKYKGITYSSNPSSHESGTPTQPLISSFSPSIGDGKDQKIADSEDDKDQLDKKEYIWWSKSYHFTTDETGKILSASKENPIEELPFVDYAVEQDNCYWSESGDDLVDSAISLNSQVAHQNHIGVVQGYGQAFYKGANVPRNLAVGPTKVILMEYGKDDPEPDFGFATSNPPLAALQAGFEMQVALLLTTNNLSTKSISTTMAAGGDFASAIAMVIDQAESTEDANEQRQIFYDKDAETFELINKWMTYYKGTKELDEDLQDLVFPEETEIKVQFQDPKSIISEKERLENIEKRKTLGLNTQAELLRMDQPDLTDKQAEEKLKAVKTEKTDAMKEAAKQAVSLGGSKEDNGQPKPAVEPGGPIQ